VIAKAVVKEMQTERHRVVFTTTCSVGDKVVLDGEATLMISRRTTC
jgi:3-hydroxybutyryl-CoA dehydratase